VFGGDGPYSPSPGDNRQRGLLLPADRPNYSRKYRLASENESGRYSLVVQFICESLH
jgi:hypothetical protein